jgi:alkanesulfonate monooxygenase SsuD/methylene tetrahydromethanopterin reductase-like flavin-dependent oxidoreductase (luciferase family)
MRLGVNVPNFGPGTSPDTLARWAQMVEGLGFDLGVGVGWARQEFDALGVAFAERGRLTDEHLLAIRAAWQDDQDYRSGQIPIWVGGNSDAALRRAVRPGDAWHPLRFTPGWLTSAVDRLKTAAADQHMPRPA